MLGDLSGLCPALFSVGTRDPLLDDTLMMAPRWLSAGNPTELAVYPGGAHVFMAFSWQLAEASLERMDAFLNLRIDGPSHERKKARAMRPGLRIATADVQGSVEGVEAVPDTNCEDPRIQRHISGDTIAPARIHVEECLAHITVQVPAILQFDVHTGLQCEADGIVDIQSGPSKPGRRTFIEERNVLGTNTNIGLEAVKIGEMILQGDRRRENPGIAQIDAQPGCLCPRPRAWQSSTAIRQRCSR
jgi:hypothetical protein